MTTSNLSSRAWEIVPLKFDFVPSEKAEAQALSELRLVLSGKEECQAWTSDYIQVIGLFSENDQEMICPSCGKQNTLLAGDVFSLGEMLFVQPADEIEFTMPCCDSSVALASIDFGPHIKFSRFGIRIEHRTNELDDMTIRKLGSILGCPMTQIHLRE